MEVEVVVLVVDVELEVVVVVVLDGNEIGGTCLWASNSRRSIL